MKLQVRRIETPNEMRKYTPKKPAGKAAAQQEHKGILIRLPAKEKHKV